MNQKFLVYLHLVPAHGVGRPHTAGGTALSIQSETLLSQAFINPISFSKSIPVCSAGGRSQGLVRAGLVPSSTELDRA